MYLKNNFLFDKSQSENPNRTYLENLCRRADDVFALTRDNSLAVILSECEAHCLRLNGDGSILKCTNAYRRMKMTDWFLHRNTLHPIDFE